MIEVRRRISFEIPAWMESTALREVDGLAHVTGLQVETVATPTPDREQPDPVQGPEGDKE